MYKKTKIVATISDRRCDVDFIQELFENGMNVVRLNTAHQSHDEALKVIKNVRKVSDKIAILLDTKGPEIRTNDQDEDLEVKVGDIIYVKGAPDEKSTPDCINMSYINFVEDVKVGAKILIDDGILEMSVVAREGDRLKCEVMNKGYIQGHKSVNIPSAMIKLPALTRKDIKFINFAVEHNLDFIAHSFVRKASDVIAVQAILDSHQSNMKIIAKIENEEGVHNIDEILEQTYGVMVARGDLAVEISSQRLPAVQRMLVKKCVEARKPVIVATQMLHSMIENPRPTRAEVNDIANAIYEGTDALMLSGETAYGQYPVEAIKMMSAIAHEIELTLPDYRDIPSIVVSTPTSSVLIKSAVEASAKLPTSAIIADTTSGNTVRGLAAYRAKTPIYAHCYRDDTVRFLALSFGVFAEYSKPGKNHLSFIRKSLQSVVKRKDITHSDEVIIISGSFGKGNGASFIEVGEIDQLMELSS
ncbi:MAG: pyruvate kinase [Bacteroidales bacterium]|nr:pyruvate kinase [Bacteroidales bacterium]